MTGDRYTRGMRAVMMAGMVALALAGGCAAEQQRVEREDRISATRLGGKFREDDPLVQMLSEDERGALHRAGMLAPVPEAELLASADAAKAEEEKSPADKAGDVMMSVLTVGVTLGMMAAPYLLF